MSSSTPTGDQITAVQKNLCKMQHFNDFLCGKGKTRIINAYSLLSEQDNSDRGVNIVLNILEAAFAAIGSYGGGIGSFASSFVSGMLNYWLTDTPPSLKGQFASTLTRFDNTATAVDAQLAAYSADVPKYWNTQFTFNGKPTTLADLATGHFPKELDPDFYPMYEAAILKLDQTVWTQMLVDNYVVTYWDDSGNPFVLSGDQGTPPIQWVQDWIKEYPAYRYTWEWVVAKHCGDSTGWRMYGYNIGTGPGVDSRPNSLSPDACQYLFKDSTPGTIINKDGLFDRATVFTSLGIRQLDWPVTGAAGAAVVDKVSVAYLRAMKEGRTLSQLIKQEGRAAIEARIIEKARQDSIFAHALSNHPRQTLEEFLGVKIPEVVSVNVTVETPKSFGLVIPMPANNQDEG
jgi:hypothetical protein